MDTSIETARFNMVQQQIRPWNVADDRVLSLMAQIPREEFVPEAYQSLAYADTEIPIDQGQVMLAPKIVAHMLQALDIRATDKILEIGAGTGYITACLCRLGGRVVSMEIHELLAAQARAALEKLDIGPADIRVGDGLRGTVDGGPFDVIAVTGSLPADAALSALQEQLAPQGRLFAVVGEEPAMQAILVRRIAEDDFRRRALFETCAPALENAPEPERFVF